MSTLGYDSEAPREKYVEPVAIATSLPTTIPTIGRDEPGLDNTPDPVLPMSTHTILTRANNSKDSIGQAQADNLGAVDQMYHVKDRGSTDSRTANS